MTSSSVKLGLVAGEESGQLLAAELIKSLAQQLGEMPALTGVGGGELQSLGLNSVFNPDEIALTGITSVLQTLPRLIMRIGQTVDAIVAAKPDCLLLIDSPDFSLRVAKRVKAKLPDLPIIKYVAPTVWAWRPARAAAMSAHIDQVLAILPFEPEIMERLGGPKTHYVGHRLMDEQPLEQVWKANSARKVQASETLNLLVLPGSRTGEIKSLIDEFGDTVEILEQRGHNTSVSIPTLTRHVDEIRRRTASWRKAPSITTSRKEQIAAYSKADAALAASGTVTLELALAGVPAVSCYKVDPIMHLAKSMITTWSGALPNLISDRAIIREYYDMQVRPALLARCVEDMSAYGQPTRQAILDGYKIVRERMKTDVPASERAAQIVAEALAVTRAK